MAVQNLTPEQVFQVDSGVLAILSGVSVPMETVENGTVAVRSSALSSPIGAEAAFICESLPESIQAIPLLGIRDRSALRSPSVLVSPTLVSPLPERTLEQRFREQADKWARETKHLSSPTQMMMHPSYQAILGMALENKREILRLLILDLQQHRNEWFWALSYLTQENPIKATDAGKMDRMIAAWVNWGRENHII
jgi:hypothetical protein